MAKKILVVDDDLDTLRLVGLLLQRKGYKIIAANHGSQAIEKAIGEQPDLVLLDVMMPDMDGIEVVRRLRSNSEVGDIPIIMFTAKTQIDDKVTGFEAGADDYLTKPTHPAELIARVKAVLARYAQKASPAPSAASEEPRKVIGVMAAKGGLGVTTVAINLGITIRNSNGQVVVVSDLRPGDGGLSLALGYPLQDSFNKLLDKMPGTITPQDVWSSLVTHSSGVKLLLASYQPSDARYAIETDQIASVVEHLSRLGQYVILDLGPSLPPATDKVMELCDQLIVVVDPTKNSVIQTKALLDDLSLKVLGLGRINVVLVNQIQSDSQTPSRQVQDRLGQNISVVFPPVPELALRAIMQNVPMVMLQKDSMTSQQFQKLAQFTLKRGKPLEHEKSRWYL